MIELKTSNPKSRKEIEQELRKQCTWLEVLNSQEILGLVYLDKEDKPFWKKGPLEEHNLYLKDMDTKYLWNSYYFLYKDLNLQDAYKRLLIEKSKDYLRKELITRKVKEDIIDKKDAVFNVLSIPLAYFTLCELCSFSNFSCEEIDSKNFCQLGSKGFWMLNKEI